MLARMYKNFNFLSKKYYSGLDTLSDEAKKVNNFKTISF
jgi:hypothetical protein